MAFPFPSFPSRHSYHLWPLVPAYQSLRQRRLRLQISPHPDSTSSPQSASLRCSDQGFSTTVLLTFGVSYFLTVGGVLCTLGHRAAAVLNPRPPRGSSAPLQPSPPRLPPAAPDVPWGLPRLPQLGITARDSLISKAELGFAVISPPPILVSAL